MICFRSLLTCFQSTLLLHLHSIALLAGDEELTKCYACKYSMGVMQKAHTLDISSVWAQNDAMLHRDVIWSGQWSVVHLIPGVLWILFHSAGGDSPVSSSFSRTMDAVSYFRTCHIVGMSAFSLYGIDKDPAFIPNLSQSQHLFEEGNYNRSRKCQVSTVVAWRVLCAVCGAPAVCRHVCEMWSGGIQGILCIPTPPLQLISPIQHRNLYSPSSKKKNHLGLSFSSSGLSFFADKCYPIHPDRCHIASLPFWYIASDPATCNKEPAPGTPLPRQHSDTGDYFKGASLAMLSAETLAGHRVHIHLLLCPLQECGYQLVSGSGNYNNTTHSVVITGHPDTVAIPLPAI